MSSNFYCMLTVAVAQSSSGGFVIRYVLPLLQMTSRFHTMGPMCIRKQQQQAKFCTNLTQILINDKDQQLLIVGCALRTKSAIYDCLISYY